MISVEFRRHVIHAAAAGGPIAKLFLLAALLLHGAAFAQALRVGILAPAQVANDPVAIAVVVHDDVAFPPPGGDEGESVTVSFGGLTAQLVRGRASWPGTKPPCCWPTWVGSLDASSLPSGDYELVATARNSAGEAFVARRTVTLDRLPVITIAQPVQYAASRLQVPISARCTDDHGCTSLIAYVQGGQGVTGVDRLETTLDVVGFDGREIQVVFEATDTRGQKVTRAVRVFVDASPNLHPVATVPGKILDADAARILYHDSTGRIFIRDRATGADTLTYTPPARIVNESTRLPQYAGLTAAGAAFVVIGLEGTNERFALKSWESGALVDLGLSGCCFLATQGRYIVWPGPGLGTLFWRDVVAGNTVQVESAEALAVDLRVAANGATAYWHGLGTGTYTLRLFEPARGSRAIAGPACALGAPRTDGTSVLFVHASDCGPGTRTLYQYKDGVTRGLASAPGNPFQFALNGGWLGISKVEESSRQLWRYDPDGRFQTITPAGPPEVMQADGAMTYHVFNARYLSVPPAAEGARVGSGIGTAVFIDGTLHVALGNSLLAYRKAAVAVSPLWLAFGVASLGTVTPTKTVTVTNDSAAALSITAVDVSANYRRVHDCASLAPGESCTVRVAFAPGPADIALNARIGMPGTLSIASSASGDPVRIALSGVGEKSLVLHYYRSVLGREPDARGEAFWQGEAARLASLGANINEAWYSMAMTFFASPEYTARPRDDAAFIADLYNTFFSRAPDEAGLGYWASQLAGGLPRDVAIVAFMFSPEFTQLSRSIYGAPTAGPEADMVMDFYRGLLARLPDSGGYEHWLRQFRTAQCQGPAAVYAQVEAISSAFANSGEYAARQRDNARYVADLYNAFLRRGGDLDGVRFWIGQLDGGARTREQLRREFMASPEFDGRVRAIVARGCVG